MNDYGTAELLNDYESCPRKAFWGRQWEYGKLTPTDFLQHGVRAGLTEPKGTDFGQAAGESLYELASTKQLDTKQMDVHSEIVHLSAISEIVTCALRKSGDAPWKSPDPILSWNPTCYLSPSGNFLRRVIFTSNWSDDKHYSFCRSWQTLGPVCHYNIPIQLAIIVLGNRRDGKYHSFWSHGLRHPQNRKLRFRKRTDVRIPFKETWQEVWREDFDDIPTADWLQAMHTDGVLEDLCFSITVPVPEPNAKQMILDLARRKLDAVRNMERLPDPNLSSCHWPTPCIYRGPCHRGDSPNGRYGFIQISNAEHRTP